MPSPGRCARRSTGRLRPRARMSAVKRRPPIHTMWPIACRAASTYCSIQARRRAARGRGAGRSLDELAGVAEAAGAHVVLRVMQERPKPDPSTYLGAGKIDVLAASCAETSVDVVVFDAELTPAQLREIEKIVGRKV